MIGRRKCRVAALGLAVAVIAVLTLATLTASTAAAHPLGNFTVNRYLRLELSPDLISLHYVVDMAEIPAFSEIAAFDVDGDGRLGDGEAAAYQERQVPRLLEGLRLVIDGELVALTATSPTLTFPEGQGGLSTLRLSFDATAPMVPGWQDGLSAYLKDENFGDRLGWKEIFILGRDGIAVPGAPATDLSAGLTAYPTDLRSAPDLREARFQVVAGTATGSSLSAPVEETVARPGRSLEGFASLVSTESLTPSFVALSLLVAAAWGAAHALGPGHGKTIVAAYLIGSRGTLRHALILGLTVTAAHTASIFALGLLTLYASQYFSVQDAFGVLTVASGVLVAMLGASLLVVRLRSLRQARAFEHAHHHDHSHYTPGHDHAHAERGTRGLLALGISGGILPCPTALVVMLGAIALDRVAYGLVLVLAFSAGLAAVLTGVGLIFVLAKRVALGSTAIGRVVSPPAAQLMLRVGPVVSAVAILALGLVLTGRAMADLI